MPDSQGQLDDAVRARHVEMAFEREQREGIRLATIARLVAVSVMLGWFFALDGTLENPQPYVVGGLLALSGLLGWVISRRPDYPRWPLFALVLLDHALITIGLFDPILVGGEPMPAAVQVRTVWFDLYFIFIAGAMVTQLPGLVVWSGLSAGVCWGTGVLWALKQPGSFTDPSLSIWGDVTLPEMLALYLNPFYIDMPERITQLIVLLLVALTMAVASKRSRELVSRQVRMERERTNLARYFSPDMVDRLASRDTPLSQPRTRDVAVLFADIVGFTRLCENAPPTEIIELLSGFRQRMDRAVFDHGGTVDKYIGDCVMATFGLLNSGPGDAGDALACGRQMLAAMEGWNRQRAEAGLPPVELGIGIHYGPVVVGDIGGDRRVEFTVIGDTVNVASRLMHLTRELDAPLVVSEEVADATRTAPGHGAALLDGFERAENVSLRGRQGVVHAWCWRPQIRGRSLAAAAAG